MTDGVEEALGRAPRDFSGYVARTDFDPRQGGTLWKGEQ